MARVSFRLLLILVASSLPSTPAGALEPASGTPKTIILGFDGMDYSLSQQFIDEGLLPNLQRLQQEGTFQRLETSNPAQSPVSWAVFNTGSNPGKTGVGGFVSRYFRRDDATGARKGNPLPQPMLGFKHELPADDFVAFPMALPTGNPTAFAATAAGVAFVTTLIVFLLLLKVVLGLPAFLAVILGLAGGVGGWMWAADYSSKLPAHGKVPYEINPMQGTNWWAHLDEAGIRTMGVQVASTFPPDTEGPNTQLLSGLGVKDIGGSPGSWFVFTDDPWAYDLDTNTAGKVKKIFFDEADGTRATVDLVGPKNWVEQARFAEEVARLEEASKSEGGSAADAAEELRAVQAERNKFNRKPEVTVPFTMDADREAGRVAFTVGTERFEIGVGDWSEFIPVEFRFNDLFSSHGVARFHLMRCDDEEVRVFVPPVNIDPYNPPASMPISSPPDFCAGLATGIGHAYETLGWACLTNPLKDEPQSLFRVQSFMDDIAFTMSRREEILAWALGRPDDWDVYYQVFSTTDRIGHMLFREFDPEHPVHDAEYAAKIVNCWGRSFPLRRALPEVYTEVDRIVGGVMEKIDDGDFGDDCQLILVSDHGFTSFRRGVNLNNLLAELGYLVFKDGQTIEDLAGSRSAEYLLFVDWEQTRAYSLGLGKIFINLQGREPTGIVAPSEYDGLIDAMRADLLAFTDGESGKKVVTSVSRRDELFSGPWWKEGTTERRFRDTVEDYEHDGFADLFIGYEPYFRVSWSNTLGGLDAASVTDSTQHWSGDHVSVDPEHVPGILFSNKKLTRAARSSLMDIGPTVVKRYGLDPASTDMDGVVLPFEGIAP